jgi:hypothetical protein
LHPLIALLGSPVVELQAASAAALVFLARVGAANVLARSTVFPCDPSCVRDRR